MLLKLVVLLSTALAVAKAAGSCDGSFKGFMQCLADGKVQSLEEEFDADFVRHVGDCFETAVSPSNTKCVLSKANLETDVYGDDGPLHGCPKCQEYAREIRDRIFKSTESLRKCFRDNFAKAVVNDLQPCIRNQLNDQSFNIPQLPDFDLRSGSFINLIEKSTSHRIMAYSRLAACADRFPDRARTSKNCLDNRRGLYKKHCALSQGCESSQVTSSCKSTFSKTKEATCKCLDIKRQEWHSRLEKVKEAVFNPEHSSTVCSSGVKQALGHWVQDFDDIGKACPAPSSSGDKIPNLPMGKLIDAGCIIGVEAANDGKQSQLLSGFRMVTEVLDAINDRVTIFCEINCS